MLPYFRNYSDLHASGFGAIICNDRGEFMAALSAKGPAVFRSEEAEVLACHKALEFTIDAGFSELVLEGDNASVMNSISFSRVNSSCLGHIYGT